MDPTWDPERADYPELVSVVARASRRFFEEVGPQQLVFGVGVTPAGPWSDKPVPMAHGKQKL